MAQLHYSMIKYVLMLQITTNLKCFNETDRIFINLHVQFLTSLHLQLISHNFAYNRVKMHFLKVWDKSERNLHIRKYLGQNRD